MEADGFFVRVRSIANFLSWKDSQTFFLTFIAAALHPPRLSIWENLLLYLMWMSETEYRRPPLSIRSWGKIYSKPGSAPESLPPKPVLKIDCTSTHASLQGETKLCWNLHFGLKINPDLKCIMEKFGVTCQGTEGAVMPDKSSVVALSIGVKDPSSHSQNRRAILLGPTSSSNYGKTTTRRATFVDTSRSKSRWFWAEFR